MIQVSLHLVSTVWWVFDERVKLFYRLYRDRIIWKIIKLDFFLPTVD